MMKLTVAFSNFVNAPKNSMRINTDPKTVASTTSKISQLFATLQPRHKAVSRYLRVLLAFLKHSDSNTDHLLLTFKNPLNLAHIVYLRVSYNRSRAFPKKQ
jgi:hypothetical protein